MLTYTGHPHPPTQGDSGGPLTIDGVLAGIVSHGHPRGCNQQNTYDVYTSVSRHIGWLNETIMQHGGMSACDYVLAIEPSNGRSTFINVTNFTNFDNLIRPAWVSLPHLS